MFGWLFGKGAASPTPILPRKGTTGAALVLVMTIMSFLACLAIWATLTIKTATNAWTAGISNKVTVQLKPPEEGPVPDADIAAALKVLRESPGVISAEALARDKTVELLKPWLGELQSTDALPLSILIDVTLDNRRDIDFEALRQRLTAASPFAVLDDHTHWTERLMAVSRSLQAITLTVLGLVLLAATAMIIFATRAGLLTHQGIVEILHLSGARAEFIAREFQQHFLRLGLRAGLNGMALAILTIAGVFFLSGIGGTGEDVEGLIPRAVLSVSGILALCLVPIGAALIATLTARLTVVRALRSMG